MSWVRAGRKRSALGSAVAPIALFVVAGCVGAASATTPIASLTPDGWHVREVIDGDTLRVTSADVEETVRLVGVNAPEHGECWADEATTALATLVADRPVTLVRDVSDRDRYGRLLRYVAGPDGADVGGLLIDAGHAIARTYPPDTARDADYRARQEAAVSAGRGAWARDACGAGAASAIDSGTILIEVHADAAGDDAANLNDEWVRLTNVGDQPLDLDGWTVRDESSSHRYRFDGLVVPPDGSVTLRSGCGVDTATERHWCVSGSAIWNNGGDTVFLLDPQGNVVALLAYPAPAGAPSGPGTAPGTPGA